MNKKLIVRWEAVTVLGYQSIESGVCSPEEYWAATEHLANRENVFLSAVVEEEKGPSEGA